MIHNYKRRKGFTIVELVIVIAVIAILAAVLIPTFSGMIDRAHDSTAKQNAKNAYTQYMIDHAKDDGVPTMFVYKESDSRFVAIKDGAVLENVYSSSADARAALVTEGDWNLEQADGDRLFKLVKNKTVANFQDPTINLSMSQSVGDDDLSFSLYHGTLSLGSIVVPETAVDDPTQNVEVSMVYADPSDSIEMGDNTKAYGYDINVTNLAEGKSVTVVLNAPIGLPAVSVYHSGEDITDQVTYDERTGSLTFETDSFSPYVIAYEEYEVSTVEELREATAIDGAYIKLTADITAYMNKGVDGNILDEEQSWYSTSYTDNPDNRLYFLALVTGVDVTFDLNGHTIEIIDQKENGYFYAGSAFTVGKGANLNLLDSVGNGKIKMKAPAYVVWSPYPNSASTDVFSGIYMSDSYVGDSYGWGYPYNCAMFYAGYDNESCGFVNIYGGYYLYNNFYNDKQNNNNGAFNVGDKATVPCIYVHDGVMLINQYYRQSTGTDDDSVFLADGCEVVKVKLDTPIVIDGVTYDTWYQVQTKSPEFTTILENTDTYLYRVGNSNEIKLGSLFECTSSVIAESATVNVTIEKLDASTNVSGTYTATSTVADWANGTLKFTGTGAVKVTINGYELLLEVVDGKNVTAASELNSSSNNILLNDIALTSSKTSFTLNSGYTLFGNGFTIDYAGYGDKNANKQGVITLNSATLDNVKIVGDLYSEFNDTSSKEGYSAAVYATGDSYIVNCYISNCQVALRAHGDSCFVENTTLYGGRYANIQLKTGVLTLKDVTTVQEKVTVDGTTCLGFGVVVWEDAPSGTKIKIEGDLTQHNWVSKADQNYMPSSASKYVDTAFKLTQFVYSYGGTDYVNLGIISISSNVLSDSIGVPNGYSAYDVTSPTDACVVSCDKSIDSTKLNNGVPVYEGWSATTQGAFKPIFTWNHPTDYNESTNTIQATFEYDETYTLDPNILTAIKSGSTLAVTVTLDGADYTGKTIPFTESGTHMLTYTVVDPYNYGVTADKSDVVYTFTINVSVTKKEANFKNADFTYTDGTATKIVEINGKKYVMPEVSATGDTIASVTVNGTTVYMPIVSAIYKNNTSDFNAYAPLFTIINVTDYAGGVPTGATSTYNTSTTTLPSGWSLVSGSPYINGAASTTADPKTYSSYGLCYECKKGSDISDQYQTVCFSYTDNAGETYYYYIQYKFEAHSCPTTCITPDTMITLTDGTQKRVDELTFGDKILVWDFFSGTYAEKDISLLINHGADWYNVVYLTYSDGTVLKLIGEHGVFDYDLNRYVYITAENATDYIGHRFVKQGENGDYEVVTLTGACVKEEYTEAWSISSSETSNVFAEGLLTVAPPDLFYNWIAMDGKLHYDTEQFAKDIETYGLYTYEDFAEYVTYEQYLAFNGAYLKIPVEKGIFTFEYILELIEMYAQWMP